MTPGSSPWYESWSIKVVAVVAGGCLIYLGQLRYEHGLRRDQLRRSDFGKSGRLKQRFDVLSQIDLAGESEANQLRMIDSVSRGLHFFQNTRSLADLRGLIWLSGPTDLSGAWLAGGQNGNGEGSSWKFEIADDARPHIDLAPVPSTTPGIICLRIPYSTASGFDRAELWVKNAGAMVARLPLEPLRPVPIRKLAAETPSAPIEVTQILRRRSTPGEPFVEYAASSFATPSPVQYRVQLKRPLARGQTAYVRLVGTEFAAGLADDGWTQFRNSEAYIISPCGVLASKAEFKVAFVTPKPVDQTVVAPLGKIVVQFEQPTFMVDSLRTISVTAKSSIELKPQGPIFKRPPHHPNLAIQVDANPPVKGLGSGDAFPDIVDRIKWVAPDPAALGLDSIWLPWGKVLASAHPTKPIQQGVLNATLRVHLTSLRVDQSFTATVPIERTSELR